MKTEVHVEAGVCGFVADVVAECKDEQHVALTIQTDCDNIKHLAQAIAQAGEIDAFNEINSASTSELLRIVHAHLKGCCAGCAVPVGLFKGMQVAAALALPKDVHIAIA
jgi:hypothetical protein